MSVFILLALVGNQFSNETLEVWIDKETQYDAFAFLQNILPYFWYISCTITAALIFNESIKKPLKELNNASQKISENQLDFTIDYFGSDELGRLCLSFEKMRKSLCESNKQLWDIVEQRKRLNAAFAHELRTPLTVLRGYSDILEEYSNSNDISPESLKEVSSAMSKQISRLENYIRTMKDIQSLERIAVYPIEHSSKEISQNLKNTLNILSEKNKIVSDFVFKSDCEICFIDMDILMQIYENIISNAVRYAKHHISTYAEIKKDIFYVQITDDGKGFCQKDMELAFEPYYHGEQCDSSVNFGLGLYICKTLCQKHGGDINISTAKPSGAKVSFEISCKKR